MKRIFKIIIGAMVFGGAWAATAHADPVTFGGTYSVSTSSGLGVSSDPLFPVFDLAPTFTLSPLNVGQSVTDNLFTLYANQKAAGKQTFSVAFDFTQPPPSFGANGSGTAVVKKQTYFFGLFYIDSIKNNSIQFTNPCVERPGIQDRRCENLAAARMRSCVRPVGAASWPLAQMGSANDVQTLLRHRCAVDPGWIVAIRRFDRSPSSSIALASLAPAAVRLLPAAAGMPRRAPSSPR